MSREHFIPGKDASLENSITHMQKQLQKLGFEVAERSWLNSIEGIWSVHLYEKDCPALFSNGKGSTKLAARASALGEFFERLSTRYFWSHYYLGEQNAKAETVHHHSEKWFRLNKNGQWPKEILTPKLRQFYNEEGKLHAKHLVDLGSGDLKRGICTLPFIRQKDNQICYFPVNLLNNLYGSNGMAAGNTREEARVQALSEIIERYVKLYIIREGICLPDIPEKVLKSFPKVASGISSLTKAGYKILVKDASLGGKFPVVNITLINPNDQGCYASFGAHPSFEVALERTLTELLQGRALDNLNGFPAPGFDLDEVAGTPNMESHFIDSAGMLHWRFLSNEPDYIFSHWDFSQNTTHDYQWMLDLFNQEGFDVYIAEFDEFGMYVCRIIVPGASEVYPSDDLEFDNSNRGIFFRENILTLNQLTSKALKILLDDLNEADIPEQQPVAPLIGLLPDKGSFWEELRIGELKTLLALATQSRDEILEGCEWIIHFGHINPERRKIYQCIETIIGLEEEELVVNDALLASFYGKKALNQAKALLSGKEHFLGFPSPGMALEGCKLHQALLKAYAKLKPRA